MGASLCTCTAQPQPVLPRGVILIPVSPTGTAPALLPSPPPQRLLMGTPAAKNPPLRSQGLGWHHSNSVPGKGRSREEPVLGLGRASCSEHPSLDCSWDSGCCPPSALPQPGGMFPHAGMNQPQCKEPIWAGAMDPSGNGGREEPAGAALPEAVPGVFPLPGDAGQALRAPALWPGKGPSGRSWLLTPGTVHPN